MSAPPFRKPRLAGNYHVWLEPPDASGDEVLHFHSGRRSVKLKGHSFREFQKLVMPLLDGQHSFEALCESVAEVFRPEDLAECLELLAAHNLLAEGASHLADEVARRLAPQLSFFRELNVQSDDLQQRLANATVTILGMSGAGAATAVELAALGVGVLRCVDACPVREADVYLSPTFQMEDVGRNRAATVVNRIQRCAPQVKASAHDRLLETEDEVGALVAGSDFVVCCLAPGQANLVFKLNRACLAARIRWTSCALSGVEVVLGPTVFPLEDPCYLCYRMRSVACSANPEDAFAYERYLDDCKEDDSERRENLVCGAGVAANLLGLEVLKVLTQLAAPSARSRIIVFHLLDLTVSKHVVLRKPWCPVCFRPEPPPGARNEQTRV